MTNRDTKSYTPSIDFNKADTKVLVECGKLSTWFNRTAIAIQKRTGILSAEDLKKEMLGDLYQIYFLGNSRTRSKFSKEVEASIVVMMQRDSLFDMVVALTAYKIVKEVEVERKDVPPIYRKETAEYIVSLGKYKLLKNSEFSEKAKEKIGNILCELS